MDIEINYSKCMARLKKNNSLQCKNNKKCGDFCKLHMNTTIENRIDWNIPISDISNDSNIKYLKKEHLEIINRFNIKQLKNTIKHYNIITNKTKRHDIIKIIGFFFKHNNRYTPKELDFIISCQNKIKYNLKILKNNKLHLLRGEALNNRSICTNDEDFLTFIKCKDIDHDDFVSFEDNAGFHYGFHIKSLYHIINSDCINPYNRDRIPDIELQRLNKLYNMLNITINNDNNICRNKEQITFQRIINIFKSIDDLGYYTQIKWFNDLNITELRNFYLQAEDIWNYRAYDLTPQIKKNIISPDGKCFNKLAKIQVCKDIDEIRNYCLDDIEKMITSGITEADKKMGAMYVLSALVIVSYNAACSLPWLLDSVM